MYIDRLINYFNLPKYYFAKFEKYHNSGSSGIYFLYIIYDIGMQFDVQNLY